MGPLARVDLRDNVAKQVQESIAKGAKCILGGEILSGSGFFYPPTVLTQVQPGMPAFDEEIFGPVIALITADNEEQAIELANNTAYGLGAVVFTSDPKRGEKIASDKLKAGTCCVNTLVASDPRLPFGGIKSSGIGRELGAEGIREFVNIKTIVVK
jgi:succinate-semialdehyde dehydrogenase/glutarate-semialdehyde dehydrogenase